MTRKLGRMGTGFAAVFVFMTMVVVVMVVMVTIVDVVAMVTATIALVAMAVMRRGRASSMVTVVMGTMRRHTPTSMFALYVQPVTPPPVASPPGDWLAVHGVTRPHLGVGYPER